MQNVLVLLACFTKNQRFEDCDCDPVTCRDDDFERIESVIGHEYFHNWSGNRVTCRDWCVYTLGFVCI